MRTYSETFGGSFLILYHRSSR